MAHNATRSGYSQLVDRLNRFPQGASPSKLLFSILEMLFSEKEASLVSLLPIKPFTAEKAGRVWKMAPAAAQRILDNLAGRGILVDIERDGQYWYVLPPPMAGFFEFSMMRIRNDIDQKILSDLFYQYLNVEEDFIRNLFATGETRLGRAFVHEEVISDEDALRVLDYERATEVIRTASHRAVGICYCRHKMQHEGRACNAPMDICMTFNTVAASLIRHGIARAIDTEEGMDLLHEAYENNLVQFGENVRERVNFICNCCGCCCEAMIAARRFAILKPVHTTNFIPEVEGAGCTGCGACVSICPVEAMTLVSSNNPLKPKEKIARLDEERCLGCGLCARVCTRGNISLKPRSVRVITPVNGTHRAVVMAVERGNLQDLIFDNRVLLSHRALAAVLGVILKLPPVKQVLAGRMLRSRYLENLIEHMQY
ncbi:MAG: 4Fe-4S dicluster domain-containing protein [Deltaproteobacteria bacterium]|nr:4Fe-4S dicluster domain-containing protein [Deltaproteobacteria bacterium]